jgi:hypothetical protein
MEEKHWHKQNINVNIVVKSRMWGRGLDSSGSEQYQWQTPVDMALNL